MLETKVEAFLRRRQISLKNKGILVGLSGGPDSLALTHFLWRRQKEWNIHLVAAHLDHMFRGKESYNEALFVKEFCEKKHIPVEVTHISVSDYMKETGLSSEAAGRDCRYHFFKEILEKYNLQYLALGHHGDDQVETILMRLTRGSTGKARAGIPFIRPFQNGSVIRPLLCVNKEEIEQYCREHNLDPRRDPSNNEGIYTRNRFRKEVLPFLKKENPKVHEHFQRFSEDLQHDEEYLQQLTKTEMDKVIKSRTEDKLTMDINLFGNMPISLQRRGIQLILNYLYKERPSSLNALHIDQIFALLSSSHPSGTLDLPNGLLIVRSYRECHFQFQKNSASSYAYKMTYPGEMFLPNGCTITMEYVNEGIEYTNINTLVFHKDAFKMPLIIRTRKQGDRMTVKGMKGSKKIKDIFINEKIPLYQRDSWPIITDSDGEIIWIPGIRKSNLTANNKASNQFIVIKYKCNDLLGGTTNHEE